MINEIKEKYNRFSDSTIYKIEYNLVDFESHGGTRMLSVFINCLNLQSLNWEKIQIDFEDVKSFRFVEIPKRKNSIVFEALIEQKEDDIVFDFFPVQTDGKGNLAENLNSDFSVRSGSLSYKVIF